jgi:hypothetical protein
MLLHLNFSPKLRKPILHQQKPWRSIVNTEAKFNGGTHSINWKNPRVSAKKFISNQVIIIKQESFTLPIRASVQYYV